MRVWSSKANGKEVELTWEWEYEIEGKENTNSGYVWRGDQVVTLEGTTNCWLQRIESIFPEDVYIGGRLQIIWEDIYLECKVGSDWDSFDNGFNIASEGFSWKDSRDIEDL